MKVKQPRILNLDNFETEIDKVVKYKGVEHKFKPFTVRDFIQNVKEMEDLARDDATEEDIVAYVNQMAVLINRAFPTLSVEEVLEMPMEMVKALTDFVRGEVQTEVEENLEVLGEDEEGKKS